MFDLATLEELHVECDNLSDEIDGDDVNQLEYLKIFIAEEIDGYCIRLSPRKGENYEMIAAGGEKRKKRTK